MHKIPNVKLFVISLLVAAGLAACDKPGPAERAGKKLDQTTDNAAKAINEVVDTVAEKSNAMADKSGVALEDAEITAKVKAAFLAEPGLKTLQISVDTDKGIVTLSGSVDSEALAKRAAGLAAAVAGVTRVENRLVAQPSS